MNLIDNFKNNFYYGKDKYKTHSQAVIIACYYNPQNNPYRLIAFNKWYDSIKHLNHRIIECVIGDAKPELPENKNIKRIKTNTLLWHKETLLNLIVKELPSKFKYVFWLDADLIFTNKNWLVEGVEALQTNSLIQPFEFCVHLKQDESEPDFNLELYKHSLMNDGPRHKKLWRSFAANHQTGLSGDNNYDKHGHVGFAWGAQRWILDIVPLYDKALIGGADHIIAHAAAGHIGHSCITKSFTDDIEAVNDWSEAFNSLTRDKVGYVKGDVYHIWHGKLENRQYLKRIQDFTSKAKDIILRDKNGLHITDDIETNDYIRKYYKERENTHNIYDSVMIANLLKETIVDDDVIYEHGQSQTGFEEGFGGGGFSGGGSSGSWAADENVILGGPNSQLKIDDLESNVDYAQVFLNSNPETNEIGSNITNSENFS